MAAAATASIGIKVMDIKWTKEEGVKAIKGQSNELLTRATEITVKTMSAH